MYDEQKIIRINDIMHSSSVDGEGFRDVLFVNYCPHHCPECHNMQTWDKKNGRYVTVGEVYKDLTKSSITNVTFSGGEPFEQVDSLVELAKMLKEQAHKTIWAYSGYTYEELIADENKKQLLEMCDVLVDGRFEKALAKNNMRFKGSENQRIIDVKKSLESGTVQLYDLEF